jgi:hypothetical protein
MSTPTQWRIFSNVTTAQVSSSRRRPPAAHAVQHLARRDEARRRREGPRQDLQQLVEEVAVPLGAGQHVEHGLAHQRQQGDFATSFRIERSSNTSF